MSKHFLPPMVLNAGLGTVLWTSYGEAYSYLSSTTGSDSVPTAAMAGACAGACQALLAAPAENVRIVLEGGSGGHSSWACVWKEVFQSRVSPSSASTLYVPAQTLRLISCIWHHTEKSYLTSIIYPPAGLGYSASVWEMNVPCAWHEQTISAKGSSCHYLLGVSIYRRMRASFMPVRPQIKWPCNRDHLRYDYEHSIGGRASTHPAGNQRLSIMVRVSLVLKLLARARI